MKHLSLQRIAPSFFSCLQSQDCNRITQSSRDRIATKGSLARCRNPAKGSFSGFAVATNYSFIQNQQQQGSLGRKQKMFLPPESGLPRKGSLARFRNPAKGSFPRFRIATEQSFLQSQECNKHYLFLQRQDCNKRGLWPDSGNQQRISFPDSGLQRIRYSSGVRIATKYLFLQSQGCNKRIFGRIQESSKGFVFHTRGCDNLINPPESGLQQKYLVIQGIAISCCIPSELQLQQKYLFLQSQDCNKRISGKFQEPSKGFVFHIYSGMQQIIYLSRIRIVTKILIPPESVVQQKGTLARVRDPAQGLFSRFGIATNHLLLQSKDCTKILIPPESELQQEDMWPGSGIQQRGCFPDSGLQ